MPHLTFLALHPAVAVLAVLAVVAPVPGQAVAVLLSSVVENVIVYDKGRFYHNFDQ